MDVSVRTQTKTSVSRKNDRITIKEVETITTTRRGQPPEVKVVERTKEYTVDNIPPELKAQLGSIADPDMGCGDKMKKTSSTQGWIQRTVPTSVERKITSPPTQIDPNDLNRLNEDCVKCHNQFRTLHGVPPLKYSKELAEYAQNWAEDLALSQRFEHRRADDFGENLYMFYSSNPKVVATAEDACNSWYAEIKNFAFGTEPRSMSAGHFTQMIWKATKEVGMGRARGPTGKQIIVANYDPPGNMIGSFASNVPAPVK